MIISDISKRERTRERVMLLAVGGESRRIVLGEVPPIQPEQEQEPAQDVAAQWLQSDDQTTTTTTTNATKTNRSTPGLVPIPQPRQRIGKFENRVPGNRNRKSRRRRITAGNHHIHRISRIVDTFDR
ncbi:uncharacterized protein LOC124950158 [Vespa velutina]|uniref:uncharacterized protein LOC124950158 n=1 Tax=Vespa velutina TaxID=202808 RepID=UPI001FB1DE23|nr:uncharacterized protein LOC124950158 [Vespa velutina]